MPVRTRSQRAKEEVSSESSGPSTLVTQNAPRRTTKRSRTSKRAKKVAPKDEVEAKSEEVVTPPLSTESGESGQGRMTEFRQYVQTILDSPNKLDLPRQQPPGPSPRIERITIQHQKHQQMEFLIPPKKQDEPIEIRERIRAALSPGNRPLGVSTDDTQRAKSKSPSIPTDPVYHPENKLWSPNTPSYDQEKADRLSRLLIMVIITILTAVFIATFQDEIAEFLKTTLTPLGQSLKQRSESIWGNISSFITSIFSGSVDEETNESIASDDSVTK